MINAVDIWIDMMNYSMSIISIIWRLRGQPKNGPPGIEVVQVMFGVVAHICPMTQGNLNELGGGEN